MEAFHHFLKAFTLSLTQHVHRSSSKIEIRPHSKRHASTQALDTRK